MISALTGELRRVEEDRVHLTVGAVVYELLVPASDVPLLQSGVGREMTFHTILYLEGDAARGNLEPRLIGFLRPEEKQFFNLFTTVKGIGPKTALRALAVPAAEIAQAIEARDTRFLVGLNGVGKRTAELIVAELAGKTQKFAAAYTGKSIPAGGTRWSASEEDAILSLMALGERRLDAEQLLERVRQSAPTLKTTDGLVREMLRMRTARV